MTSSGSVRRSESGLASAMMVMKVDMVLRASLEYLVGWRLNLTTSLESMREV